MYLLCRVRWSDVVQAQRISAGFSAKAARSCQIERSQSLVPTM